MVPSQPTTHLVIVKADFAFGFFEDGFDRPAHPAYAHELAQGRVSRGVAEVVFDHRRIVEIAADDQPEFTCGQVCARLAHAQKGKVANNGAFAAFLDSSSHPIPFGDVSHQLLHLKGARVRIAQTQTSWTATATFPLGNMHFRAGAPDGGRAFDLGEIPLAESRDAIPKSGRSPCEDAFYFLILGTQAGMSW